MRRSQACNKFQWGRALQPERSNRFELCSYRFLCSSKCTGTGYGVSESFGVSRFNDAPPRLKSTPHLSAAALPKSNAVFYFPASDRHQGFPFIRHPERQNLWEKKAHFLANGIPTQYSYPHVGDTRRNNNPLRFSREGSAGARLPIVNQDVHDCACFFRPYDTLFYCFPA